MFNITSKEALVELWPVPWEVTASYGRGTSLAPQIIQAAFSQLDYFDPLIKQSLENKIFLWPQDNSWLKLNDSLVELSRSIHRQENSSDYSSQSKQIIDQINSSCEKLCFETKKSIQEILFRKKIAGLIGGDHSCAQFSIEAHLEQFPSLGILHIDAHADLRYQYQGFKFSHASFLRNIADHSPQTPIVQVGIRDLCQDEFDYLSKQKNIHCFFDAHLARQQFEQQSWKTICEKIISCLPDQVYITFDIDGLTPSLCPHTGTPVPGGLTFHQTSYLLYLIAKNRTLVGFDLCEVSSGTDLESEWDANVGARILYMLCQYTYFSQNKNH